MLKLGCVPELLRRAGHRPARPSICITTPWLQQFTAAAADPLQLVIQAHAGDAEVKTLKLEVQSDDTVASVKQKIQDMAGSMLCVCV